MSVILLVAFTVIVAVVGYKWMRLLENRRKLSWLPSVPGWPLIGNILELRGTTVILESLLRISRNHGKLVFLNYATSANVHATDYDFIEFLLSSTQIINKSAEYELLHPWLGTGLLTSWGQKWRKRRKMITPAFHFSILENFIESFESNGIVLIEKLKQLTDKDSVDIYHYVKLYALDNICETAMGVNVGAQKDEGNEYVQHVTDICRISIERAFSLLKYSDITFMFYPDYWAATKILKHLHSVTDSVIESRRQTLANEKEDLTKDVDIGAKKKMAFLDILLKSTIDGQPLSTQDIREEVDTFMFEGHDTTASAMAHTLYMLARHKDVQRKVVEEQRKIFAGDIHRQSNYRDLQEMKYLECVIKETLRIYPSVPMFTRAADNDIYYKGNIIPKGTSLSIFVYGMMKDPDYFPEPDKFDPGRFETTDGTKPYSYIPFSAGPRNCIGQKFAMLEAKSAVSKILRNFELHPTNPEHQLELAFEAILKSKNGVKIKLSERKW